MAAGRPCGARGTGRGVRRARRRRASGPRARRPARRWHRLGRASPEAVSASAIGRQARRRSRSGRRASRVQGSRHGGPAHAGRALRRPARLPVRRRTTPRSRPVTGRHGLARALRRRGPRRRRPGAAHARRAVVELPLPQDDPGPRRRRPARASRPTSSASGARDKPTQRSDYTYARHVEWMRAGAVRPPRPPRHHARRPGLGRAHRAAAGRPSTRPLRRGSSRPTRSCRPVTGSPARRSSPGRSSRRRRRSSTSAASSAAGASTRAAPGGGRGVRRAVPRRHVQGGRPPVPDARPHLARRPRRGGRTASLGGARRVGRSRCSAAFSDQRPVTAGADRVLHQVPCPAGQGPAAHD